MNIINLKLSALLILGFSLLNVQAQESIPAAGGMASGSGGSASYTLGQVFYHLNTGTKGTIQQGIQQPYEIFIVSGLEKTGGISLKCMIFPNPTADKLTLKIENYDRTDLSFQLFNSN